MNKARTLALAALLLQAFASPAFAAVGYRNTIIQAETSGPRFEEAMAKCKGRGAEKRNCAQAKLVSQDVQQVVRAYMRAQR